MTPPVVMMENHDQAYHAWKRAGFQNRILVHIDPHFDFGFINEKNPQKYLSKPDLYHVEETLKKWAGRNYDLFFSTKTITIGNFIYPAISEGIVRELYWVVPDAMWNDPIERKGLYRMLVVTFQKAFPDRVGEIHESEQRMRSTFDGVPTFIGPLASLPCFAEPVLLDIDTDFFIINRLSRGYPYFNPEDFEPWTTPADLFERLRNKKLQSDFITIAYSVEGGFTPLEYKYLGDELKNLLQNTSSPHTAALHFHKAKECQKEGRLEEARPHYRKAVEMDPTYETPFNNFGLVCQYLDRWEKSRDCFEQLLQLDPKDAGAHFGMGEFYAHEKKWLQAEDHYRKAFSLKPDLEDLCYGLAQAMSKQGRYGEALSLLESTSRYDAYLTDSWHLKAFLYRKLKKFDQAIENYEAFFRNGGQNSAAHFHLGLLYLRKKRYYKARRRLQTAIRRLGNLICIFSRRNLLRTKGSKGIS